MILSSLVFPEENYAVRLLDYEAFWLSQVWRVERGLRKEVAAEDIGKFYDSSCYIVLYTYQGSERKEEYLISNWIGRHALPVR